MRRRRWLISGPVLLGFASVFDAAYGNPKTPRPYPRVTPSHVGGVLLPFPCPHCGAVRKEPVDRKKADGYRDKERGFAWCPACRGRYVMNRDGVALVGALPKGADAAPAFVERDGARDVLALRVEDGLDVLGAE